jgi:hypothetical protein
MLIDKFILSKLLAAKWAWVELTETVSRILLLNTLGPGSEYDHVMIV